MPPDEDTIPSDLPSVIRPQECPGLKIRVKGLRSFFPCLKELGETIVELRT
jgi:hypothetical protein